MTGNATMELLDKQRPDTVNPGWIELYHDDGRFGFYHPKTGGVARIGLLVRGGLEIGIAKRLVLDSWEMQSAQGGDSE